MERRPIQTYNNNSVNNMNTDSLRSSLFSTSNGPARSSASSNNAFGGRPGSSIQMSQYGGGRGAAAGNPNDRIYAEQSERLMEAQNEEQTNLLAKKVDMILNLSKEIGIEVREQNRMLDGMDTDFEKTQGFMKKTLGGMSNMLQTGGSKHMCYLVMFIFGLFLLVYWLVR